MAAATSSGLPWPEGDPSELRAAAGDLGAVRERLSSLVSPLRGAASSVGDWTGPARSAFDAASALASAGIDDAASVFETAAGALNDLAAKLEQAQARVEQAARRLAAAEEAAAGAGRAAASARSSALAFAGTVDPVGAVAAVQAEQAAAAAEQRFREAADTARWTGQAAYAEAQEAMEAARAADRATAALLDGLGGLSGDRLAPFVPDAAAAAMPRLGGITYAVTSFLALHLAGLTREDWQRIAYRRAGIDSATWEPERGLLANDATVQAVYRYYGNLWLRDPDLQWAGMAAIAGGAFYGGWQDLYALRQVTDHEERADLIDRMIDLPAGAEWADDAVVWAHDHAPLPGLAPGLLAEDLAAGELAWFEAKFLRMQKRIFDDLAWQHEAYLYGGIGLIQSLAARGQIANPRLVAAWEDIASGDRERAAAGNEALLRREQFEVIQADYAQMRRRHGPIGEAFTYLLTWTAESPIPGGRPYREVVTRTIDLELVDLTPGIPFTSIDPPWGEVHYELTLPRGNLADFDDRWEWIKEDMLPRYEELEPHQVRSLVRISVTERAAAFRKLPDLPYAGGS